METHISSSNLIETIETISSSLNLACQTECEEASVSFPSRLGKGSIKGINFQNGLGLFLLDFKLKKDLTLKYRLKTLYPVKAIFCKEGTFNYQFEGHEISCEVEPLRSFISASSDHHHQCMHFPADTRVVLSVLEIDREQYIGNVECELDSIPDPLASVLRDYKAEDPFLYQGDYSLAIAEVVSQVHTNSFEGLERRAFLESKALELFSLTIRQYKDDQNPNVKRAIIRKSDLQKIELAKEILTMDLAKSITIPELAKRVGMNENKLKRGFKQAYDSTVNQFLIKKRMEYARVLLLSDAFSILEVADKVGYKNVGYFTRRFREKYGMLPKDFVKNNKVRLSAS